MKMVFVVLSIIFSIILSLWVGYFFGWNDGLRNNDPAPTKPIIKSFKGDKLFQVINDYRVSEGVHPYKESDETCKLAKIRLPEIRIEFNHDKFDERMDNYPEGTLWGENLAMNVTTEEATLLGWLNSPKHRDTLERGYTHSCIATDGTYVVHIFGYY